MSPREVAHSLSVIDLLRVLNEKLGLECSKVQGIASAVSVASMETEIESLESRAHDVLRFIPSLRNLLQPVNRLPPEILSRIARDVPDQSAKDARSVIPLTHVCRYWRNSIASASEIWTSISSWNKHFTLLSLERAREAPLRISIDLAQVKTRPWFSELIAPRIQNTAALEFSGLTTPETITKTLPNFPRSMPNLRSLDLSLWGAAPFWDSSVDPFKSFPSNLNSLFLYHIPLYPSVLNVRTLTELTFHNFDFDHPLDTLLTMLEENHSLRRVDIMIIIGNPNFLISHRRTPIRNQLQHLSLTCYNAETTRVLISNIPLQRGASLEINNRDSSAGMTKILSSISATHLANLPSPTHMHSCERDVKLTGSNGSFSFSGLSTPEMSFTGLPLLSFDEIRELRFGYPRQPGSTTNRRVFNPSPFPALETLVIEHDTNVSNTLSTLLSSPQSSPSLKTLAFLDCNLPRDFMKGLEQFASDRQNTMSAWLHRIVIVHSDGFPGAESIRALGRHVAVVDVRFGTELPMDLT
ncbi:hypothetical protein BJ322DRAFT_1065152 [Thelephora terrestris]|uniref:F-box domain-containing protein n=1 Tax=Thelephora terrestris TaxID=56493 RepID=A0A9P6HDC1_9AGAM|nr:hypothetical protein BJ322DRAFT_1065152 [Thelephora terrestris]